MTKDDFWNWFDNNKTSLESLISEKTQDYKIYEELSDRLIQYNEFLIPEITINEEDKFVLVISCDGIRQGIPFVEAITENLRKFDNWVILKFRQPAPMELIPLNDLNLKRTSILLEWEKTPSKKYFITFYIKGFSSHNKNYKMATLLHMDHTIGEYNAMTQIEGVEMKSLGLFQSKKGLSTLDDLKRELDSNFT
jgi:hypothetical protein